MSPPSWLPHAVGDLVPPWPESKPHPPVARRALDEPLPDRDEGVEVTEVDGWGNLGGSFPSFVVEGLAGPAGLTSQVLRN